MHEAKAATLTRQTTTFALAGPTPHAVIDVLGEGVFEALRGDGATLTDPLGGNDPETVARKEDLRGILPALSVSHPFSTHVGPFVGPLLHSIHSSCIVTRMSFHVFTRKGLLWPRIRLRSGQ